MIFDFLFGISFFDQIFRKGENNMSIKDALKIEDLEEKTNEDKTDEEKANEE